MDPPSLGIGPPRSGMGLLMPDMGASRSGRILPGLVWTSSGPTWALRGLVWALRGVVWTLWTRHGLTQVWYGRGHPNCLRLGLGREFN